MYVVAAAWLYVVGMMAVAEALSSQGSVLGALITLVFYGLLPLSIVLYVGGTAARRRARQAAQAAASAPEAPDRDGHPAVDAVPAIPVAAAVTPERKEG